MTRAGLSLALILLGSATVWAQSPAERGVALRARLGQGPVKELVGEAELVGRLPGGGARTYVLQTETQLVAHEGVQRYRIRDRLRVDLRGLGTARLRVEGDLALDLTPERLLLVSEEPRGRGLVVETRVELRRTEQGFLRTLTRGEAAPVAAPLSEAPGLVLTPPLGVGLRLAALAEPTLGARYSLPAFDLETAYATRWQLSVDEGLSLELEQPTPGLVLTWREGGAKFFAWRPEARGSGLVRLGAQGEGARFEVRAEALRGAAPAEEGPAGAVVACLHALARGDGEALRGLLDLGALQRRARQAAGLAGEPSQAERERFARVALERLCQESWLEDRGLRQSFASARAAELSVSAAGERARVALTERPELAFELARDAAGRWRIEGLPLRAR